VRPLRHLLGLGLVLVRDVELDRARRTLREVLVAVNRATPDVDKITRLHNSRRLALDGEGDFPFLHRPPLVARVAMELVARARRNHDGLQAHHAGRILLERSLNTPSSSPLDEREVGGL
jgi:hypothetical protein